MAVIIYLQKDKYICMKNILLILLIIFTSSCSFRKDFKVLDRLEPIIEPIVEPIKEFLIENTLENNSKVIIRDKWNVPHIYGHSDADAAFSLAYAHAQDDFHTIHEAILKARGEYASVYGAGPNKINAIFDYMVGLLKLWEIIDEKYYTDLSPETISLCEAYADGINAYIEHNKKNIKQYVYPLSGKDVVAGFLHKTPTFYKLPFFLSDLYTKNPEDIPSEYTTGDTIEILKNLDIKGSNVYAVSPDKTNKGETYLAINAHQPFDGELAWYEAHINSNEGWNMLGGLFPGSPVVLVGHNKYLGWGHTVNNPDIVDIYNLEINPDNGNQYWFDGEWIDFESFDVTIKIKVLGKALYNYKEKAFWSIHGPVIKGEKATYAVKYSKADDIRIIEQWYKMNKATNFDQWKNAMEMMSIPMFNAGYADNKGNIFYLYNASLPIRNEKYNWKKVLPGNTSNALWSKYLEFDNLPMVKNPSTGYIQNCNSTPFITTNSNDDPDKSKYSKTFGIETHMTNRALRALETFGQDSSITYQEFKNYKFDKYYSKNSSMAFLVKRAIKLLEGNYFHNSFEDSTIDKTKEIFTNWDLSTGIENQNATLPILSFAKIIDLPPTSVGDSTIVKDMSFAMNYLINSHSALDVKWGDVNRLIRGETNLPLSGGPDIARAVYGIPQSNGQLKAIAGDCYILFSVWNQRGKVYSESIHQYGSATQDINSEHYDNQTKLYSNEKFKKMSIYKKDVIKGAKNVLVLD